MTGFVFRRMTHRWLMFWFEPRHSTDLGVSRVLFFGLLFVVYFGEDFSEWGSVSEVFWMPIWVFERLGLPALNPKALAVLQFSWKVALAMSAVGMWTRLSMAVSFMAGAYLLALPHNFGHTYHFDALLVFVMGVLAVSRAGDSWSIDALVSAYRRPHTDRPARSGEFAWPIRAVWVLMALVFMGAGLSKLRHAGISWVLSDTMRTTLVKAHYSLSDADPLVSWGLVLAGSWWAPRVIAGLSLTVELLFPLALLSAKARALLVPAAAGLLVSIRALMGPTFGGFLIANVFWIPWRAIGARVRARLAPREPIVVLFDGSCGTCTGTVAVLNRLDLLGRVSCLDASRDSSARQRFGVRDRHARLDEMHAVTDTGEILCGFDLYRRLAQVLPLGWTLLPVLAVPGVPRLGQHVYGRLAARGHQTVAPVPE
jgi:predicted DCC family thiol-disulfide oxidoreductase YuxK